MRASLKANSLKGEDAKPPVYGSTPRTAGLPACRFLCSTRLRDWRSESRLFLADARWLAVAVCTSFIAGTRRSAPLMQQLFTTLTRLPRVSLRHCLTVGVALCALHAADAAAPALLAAPAPDFALKAAHGGNIRLSEHLGEVVVINFWATWCGPCRQEMPLLNDIHDKYQRAGLVLFGINIDDHAKAALEMAQTLGITYPMLFDARKDVARSYQLGTMPLTVLIDREGVVRYVSEGYKPGYEKRYTEQLRELLGE